MRKDKFTFFNKMDIAMILLTLYCFLIKIRRTSIQYKLITHQCCRMHPPGRRFVARWWWLKPLICVYRLADAAITQTDINNNKSIGEWLNEKQEIKMTFENITCMLIHGHWAFHNTETRVMWWLCETSNTHYLRQGFFAGCRLQVNC